MIGVELSVDDVDAAVAVDGLGVRRIELCSAGALGGLTPGPGLLKTVLARCRTEVHVLVRPRAGHFRYSRREVEAMRIDVAAAVAQGAAGVVVGAVTEQGEPDYAVLDELVAEAGGRAVTFHRAIDVCRDPVGALARLADHGVCRVLSSGGAVRAVDGVLAEMVRAAGERLTVLGCGGIRARNLAEVLAVTGVTEVHAAPRRPEPAPGSGVDFGGHPEFDLDEARALVNAAASRT